MKKGKCKQVDMKNELSPWVQVKETDRQFQDSFATLSLYHSPSVVPESQMPESPTGYKSRSAQLRGGSAKTRAQIANQEDRKVKTIESEGRALTMMKNYCKKMYTEPANPIVEPNPESVRLLKVPDKKTFSKTISYGFLKEYYPSSCYQMKRTNVVDLTRSLNQQLGSSRKKQVVLAVSRRKIVQVKPKIKSHKESQKRGSLQSKYPDFYPQSRSLPLRRSTLVCGSRPSQVVFPADNFNELLSRFLCRK